MNTVIRSRVTVVATLLALFLALCCCFLASPCQAHAASAKLGKVKIASIKEVPGDYVRVTWNKAKKAKKYQVQVAFDKKFTKLIKNKKTSKTEVKIFVPERYNINVFVKVRAYNSKKVYGKWSKAKKYYYKGIYYEPPDNDSDANPTDGSGAQGSSGGDTSIAHEHNYQPGGSYSMYDQERAKHASEALKNHTLMLQYSQTHSWQNGTFDGAVYSHYEALYNYHVGQATYYCDLRDAEYYCTICGEKKPASASSDSLAAASLAE